MQALFFANGSSVKNQKKEFLFLLQPESGFIDLGTLGGDCETNGVNNQTQVVGFFSKNGYNKAFIWDSSNGMRSLKSLIPSYLEGGPGFMSDAPEWILNARRFCFFIWMGNLHRRSESFADINSNKNSFFCIMTIVFHLALLWVIC